MDKERDSNQHDANSMTKELVIVYGDIKGSIEITPTQTLSDVRVSLKEEWDDDMMPSGDFAFQIGEFRKSKKQEMKMCAWDIHISKSVSIVSIHDKKRPPSYMMEVAPSGNCTSNAPSPAAKRLKLDNESNSDVDKKTTATTTTTHRARRAPSFTESCSVEEALEKQKDDNGETPLPAKRLDFQEQSSSEPPPGVAKEPEDNEICNGNDNIMEADADDLPSLPLSATEMDGATASATTNETTTTISISQPSEADLITATNRLFSKSDPSTTTLKDIFGSIEADFCVSLVKTTKIFIRKHLAALCTGQVQQPSAAVQDNDDAANGALTDTSTTNAMTDADADDSGAGTITENPTGKTEWAEMNNENDDGVTSDSDATVPEQANVVTPNPNGNDDDDDEVVAMDDIPEHDAHKEHDDALEKSCTVLRTIDTLLKEHPLFCSEDRRREWSADISKLLAKSTPKTIIGVLGNTGVGKSSLLNALLDEAAVRK
jgi:hypothetical protein